MSYLYSLLSRLFTSDQNTSDQDTSKKDTSKKDTSEQDTSKKDTSKQDTFVKTEPFEKPVNNYKNKPTETVTHATNDSDLDKINELTRLVDRLEKRVIDTNNINEKLQDYIDNLIKEKLEIEAKYNKECDRNQILRERFIKEPDVTTLFAGLDLMTVNQFKNIIPKMDLSEFSNLSTKDKYLNACMFMLVRKFNAKNEHDSTKFIDYVLTNDSLTVDVRNFLNDDSNNVAIRRELCNFYEFAKIFAE